MNAEPPGMQISECRMQNVKFACCLPAAWGIKTSSEQPLRACSEFFCRPAQSYGMVRLRKSPNMGTLKSMTPYAGLYIMPLLMSEERTVVMAVGFTCK